MKAREMAKTLLKDENWVTLKIAGFMDTRLCLSRRDSEGIIDDAQFLLMLGIPFVHIPFAAVFDFFGETRTFHFEVDVDDQILQAELGKVYQQAMAECDSERGPWRV